jgi:two-component system, cell cycle response regulator
MNSRKQQCRVLIVDDSPVYRKLMEQVLEAEPYTLMYAKNGKEALELYREHAPAIVITDWMMPDLSGLDLCHQIRRDTSHGYAYLILMTSNSAKTNVIQGLRAGADDYLTKPFDAGEMLARIEVGRRTVQLHQELAAKSRRLEEAARTDPLTGLPNRRALEEWACNYLHGAARHGFYFWVALCDVDSFKAINDTFGHEAGDTVLRVFSELLMGSIRKSDVCGRLGGDEFLILMTHVDPADIQLTFNRLREKFAELSFPFAGQAVKLTVSFGVAGFEGKALVDLKTLLREADRMLYEAKRQGRNCVRVTTVSGVAVQMPAV